jgi:hypothetical protein
MQAFTKFAIGEELERRISQVPCDRWQAGIFEQTCISAFLGGNRYADPQRELRLPDRPTCLLPPLTYGMHVWTVLAGPADDS